LGITDAIYFVIGMIASLFIYPLVNLMYKTYIR